MSILCHQEIQVIFANLKKFMDVIVFKLVPQYLTQIIKIAIIGNFLKLSFPPFMGNYGKLAYLTDFTHLQMDLYTV